MPHITETTIETPIPPPISSIGDKTGEKAGDKTIPSIPPPISKRGIEEMKKARELPSKPGGTVSFSEMIEWLKLLKTEEQKKRITLYVYRLHPIIIRQKDNPDVDNNIDVICDGFETLTEEYFRQTHGGGTYSINIADSDSYKSLKGESSSFRAKFTIPMIEYEPKLNYKEVEWTNPKNAGFQAWARAKGKIDSNNMPIDPNVKPTMQNGSTTPNPDSTVTVMKTMMEFFKSMGDKDEAKVRASLQAGDPLSKAMGEIFVEKLKQDDPSKTANMFTSMLNAVTGIANQNKGGDGGGIATIIPIFQMMMQSQQETTKLILETIKANQQHQSGGDDGEGKTSKLDELRALIDIAKELKGGTREAAKSTTEMLIDKGLDVAIPVVQMVGNIIALKMSQTPGMPNSMGGSGGSGQQQPAGGQQANVRPQPTGQAPPTQQTQPTPISAPANGTSNVDPYLANAIREFAPLILANLNKEGFELPEMICSFYPQGDMIVASIIKFGPENILNAMKAVPELWNQISIGYGEPHTVKWVEDFVNYKEILAEIASGDGDTDDDDTTKVVSLPGEKGNKK